MFIHGLNVSFKMLLREYLGEETPKFPAPFLSFAVHEMLIEGTNCLNLPALESS